MSTLAIAPFGFFTYDAFRAGWFFLWRICLYTLPALVVVMIGAALLVTVFVSAGVYGQDSPDQAAVTAAVTSGRFWVGFGLITLGGLAGFIASIPLTTRIARRWAERTWHRTFAQGVWWAITWRVFLVSLLASVIGQGVNTVSNALTADTAGLGSNLVGLFLTLVVFTLNIVVTLLSYGWAMSRVVVRRIGGVGVATSVIAGLNPLGYTPPAGAPYTAPPRPVPVTPRSLSPESPLPAQPADAPVMAPPAPPPPGGAAPGRRRCPKCSLYETEKGTVLGWYCKVCGWSESRA